LSIESISSGTAKKFTRTPELIDVWFDSGAMPFAQLHYPFENREEFERSFPADYICEAVDQTRGWFYTLHAIATLIFDKPAFKNLIVNGHILDKHKQKMSKSKGNVVDPFVMIEKYGADSLRWYLINSSPAWLPKAFDEEEISEEQRKFFRSFIESYRFFTLYANVDGFEYKEERLPISERTELDRWILSSLNTLIKAVDEAMSNYDPTSATRLIEDFTVNNLSNWYIRRSRRRFWKGEMGLDKLAAYQTLYECLITVAKLVSPFCPFIADEIYRNLNTVTGKEPYESVHLSYFPQVEEAAIDKALEMRMKKAQSICSLALSLRKKAELKVRQPLRRMLLPVLESHTRRELEKVKDIILDEVNIKAIEFVDDETGIISKKAKPNFKTLGKKFGKDINAVANRVRALSAQEIAKLEKAGEYEFEVAGRRVKIEREDVEILSEDLEGWLVASDDSLKLTVALDTELSEELIHEGLAREFVSRVQACRKEMGLDITDRIVLHVNTSKTLQTALERNKDYVQNETLATELDFVLGTGKRFVEDINGESCTIELEKK
jgi:isoleucyl-tRNA synthetase